MLRKNNNQSTGHSRIRAPIGPSAADASPTGAWVEHFPGIVRWTNATQIAWRKGRQSRSQRLRGSLRMRSKRRFV